jgi:hypothetical protein
VSRSADHHDASAAGTGPVRVEILYFDGCPNHIDLAHHIRSLMAAHQLPAEVTEHRVDTNDDAQRLAFLGSPTVRINGHDVDPTTYDHDSYGLQCRLYATSDGLRGTPPDSWILNAALRDQSTQNN